MYQFFNGKAPFVFSVLTTAGLLLSCGTKPPDTRQEVSFTNLPEENRIEVYVGAELLTAYIYPGNIAKPVLYPLKTASGKTLTRGFPLDPRPGERADHPHHVGHWFNYGDVNGLDFWNNSLNFTGENMHRYGYIEHHELLNMKGGKGEGILEVSELWKDYDNNLLLNENTVFYFSAEGTTRIIDRITTLTANEGEVLFKDNKEGMVAIRVARELEIPLNSPAVFLDSHGNPSEVRTLDNEGVTGNYLSSEGITGEDVWGTRARWVMLSGTINDEPVALALIDHPANVGYPTYWHARGYGLFSANPLGQSVFSEGKEVLNFSLPAGEQITFRYRLLVHSGDKLEKEKMDRLADDFEDKYH